MKIPAAVCFLTAMWSEPTRNGDQWESELFVASRGNPDQPVGLATGKSRTALRIAQVRGVLRVLAELRRSMSGDE